MLIADTILPNVFYGIIRARWVMKQNIRQLDLFDATHLFVFRYNFSFDNHSLSFFLIPKVLQMNVSA